MTAALIAGPSSEPLSLAEAKAHLRVESDDEDALISAAITAARTHVEALTRRRLISQSWRIYRDAWPKDRVVMLPVSPLISVDAVTVYDAAGDPQTVDAEAYSADLASDPPRLSVPTAMAPGSALNGIEIDVTAGYGAAAADVPPPLRQAILMLVADWHETRGIAGFGEAGDVVPAGFLALIRPYRAVHL